ncbi:hypothetical protein BDN70DRAFT_939436, partial [Pholiota conissans]
DSQRKAKPSASEPDSDAPKDSKGKATQSIRARVSDDEQSNEGDIDVDEQEDEPTSEPENSTGLPSGPSEEQSSETSDNDDDVDEGGPDMTEVSSSHMSTRPSSRASDVSMDPDEDNQPSDSSMRDLTGYPHHDVDTNESAQNAVYQARKRSHSQIESPPSPSAARDARRRIFGQFSHPDESIAPLSSFTDYLREQEKATEAQKSVHGLLPALPITERTCPPPPRPGTMEWRNMRLAEIRAKQAETATSSRALPLTQPSSKPRRDASETFSRLQGRGPTPVTGSSSASTSLTGLSGRTTSGNTASAPRVGSSIGSSGSSSSRPTIPAHRLPASFQPVTPPKALPPKTVTNPFAAKKKANEKRR